MWLILGIVLIVVLCVLSYCVVFRPRGYDYSVRASYRWDSIDK